MFNKSELALGLLLLNASAAIPPAMAQQSPTDVLIQRARTLDGQGRHDLAAAAWRQVLLLNPTEPDALSGLAAFYQSNGDTVTADHYLALLRSAKPGAKIPTAHVQVGPNSEFEAAARLAAQHRYQEALALYRKAFHGTVPSGMWAVSYYETEAAVPADLPQAVAGMRELQKQYPANPGYQLALGRILTYDEKTRLEGVQLLANVRGTAEQTEQARVAWRQAILFGGPAASTVQEYLARYPDEQLAARVQSAQADRSAHAPVAGQAAQGAAYAALHKGNLAEAQHLFEGLLSIPPQKGKALAGLGYINMQQQDFVHAREHFEQAESAGFHSPELSSALVDARYWTAMQEGNRALDLDDLARAMTAFEQAQNVKPSGAEALQGQAGVFMQKGQPEKALSLFEQAVRLQQDRPQGWTAWFDALVQADRSKEVIADQPYIAAETMTKLEADPDYLAVLAAAEISTGNQAEAHRLTTQLAKYPDQDKRSAAQLRGAELLALTNPRSSAALALDVIRVKPETVRAWKLLIRDEHVADRDQMALTAIDRMPASVYQEALKDVDFVTILASVHQEMKQYSTASNLLEQARTAAQGDAKKLSAIEAQTASLLLAEGNAESAYKIYVKIVRRSPEDSVAWNGLISALHQAKQDDAALTQIQQLPPEVAEKLERDPGFLQTLASVYSATGHNQWAVDTMGRVMAQYQPGMNDAPYNVQAQYCWLLLNTGDEARLANELASIGRRPDLTAGQKQQTSDLWAAWSVRKAAKEEKSGNSKQAIAILELAAQAYPENGEIRRAVAGTYIRNKEGKRAFVLYQQIDWSKATAVDYAGALAAASAARQKDAGRQWLADGLVQFPGNPQLLTAAAQFEESVGDTRKAELYWRQVIANSSQAKLTQQLAGVNPAAAPSAVTASEALAHMLSPANSAAVTPAPPSFVAPVEPLQDAITALPPVQHPASDTKTDSSDQASPWLVRKVPATSQHAQPIVYQAPGSNTATSRWAVSLNDAAPSSAPVSTEQVAEPEPTRESMKESMPASMPESAPASAPAPVVVPVQYQQPVNSARVEAEATAPSSYDSAVMTRASLAMSDAPRGAEYAPADPAAATAIAPAGRSVLVGPGIDAQTQLEGLASRYSNWTGGGTQLGNRSGQAGFDQLTRMEASFEASAVLGENARFTVRALPVLLSSGAPDGTSNLNFGTSGAALIGQSHFQSGVGAEVQLATRVLDGALGFSPSTFYVSHLLGNVNVHPVNFPFNLRIYRDQIKETMLSYAGEKDPLTGQIWGGVVATGAEGGLNLGSAQSGFYVTGGGSQLTGVNVNKNNRVHGSTGAYWSVYSNPYGTLKMGVNLTGLHYAQNQRYFTFGQGGYFSPDSYVLLNTPFSWESRPMNRLTYRINGSLGVQSFQEGTALPGSLVATDTLPTAQSNFGANYNLEGNFAYRFDEHWYMGGFVGVNNASNYQDRTAGVSVKYMQRPQVDVEGGPTGLFDERKVRPLIVP